MVQVMTCCLFHAKQLPEPTFAYDRLDPYEQSLEKFKSKLFIYDNTSENVVCEKGPILSWG